LIVFCEKKKKYENFNFIFNEKTSGKIPLVRFLIENLME